MLLKKNEKTKFIVTMVVVVLGIAILSILYFINTKGDRYFQSGQNNSVMHPKADNGPGKTDTPIEDVIVKGDIIVKPTIDYKHLAKDQELKELMDLRKQNLGLYKSLDMIVNSDETFTIGGVKISMSDILKKAFLKDGEIFEEKIEHSGEIRPQKIKEYGIYVVQSGDNIWNIHFHILKEFYDHKNIRVSPKADEPGSQGLSSGVGKILKFSETMVIIYNLIEKKIDTNIDLLEPLSKIIIYNMDEVFSFLTQINYENIDRIRFDGKTIWIPTEK